MRLLTHIALATILALCAVAGVSEERTPEAKPIVVADREMTLDQAVAMVERRFKARVVRKEVRQSGERKIYVLRLLNDEGRVWTVRVDAASGAII